MQTITQRRYSVLISTVILLSIIVMPACVADAQQKPTIHALLVIMDGDPLNFQQYKVNARWMKDLLNTVKHKGVCELKRTVFNEENEPTADRILNWISAVSPQNNDVIFIYYSGHGARHPQTVGDGTYFDLPGEKLYRKDVVDTLKTSPAWKCRLKILITDTCAVEGEIKEPRELVSVNYSRDYKVERAYTHLFVDHEGFLHLNAASPDEFSWGDSTNGSWFTNGLVRSIHSHAEAAQEYVEWNEIFTDAKREVQTFIKANEQTVGRDLQHPWAYSFPELVTDSGKWANLNTVGMVMVPAGEFRMGSNIGYNNEKPVHSVYIDAFYMDKHEVTNAQYKAFLDANPKWQKGAIYARTYANGNYLRNWKHNAYPAGKANHPVVWVSWYAAMAYAEWAGKRLPTEAEWEKAARGGLVGKKFPWGNLLDSNKATFGQKWDKYAEIQTTPVGNYAPNGYGLYDMAGNVYEWCLDPWDPDAYAERSGNWAPVRNPIVGYTSINQLTHNFMNSPVHVRHVTRGGSWTSVPKPGVPEGFRCANRNAAARVEAPAKNTGNQTGFRCVSSHK